MFTSDMAESRQKTVVLQGLDAGMFGEILSYIYSGTLHVSLDKVQPLYQAADLLQLDYVRDTCSSYMAMNVERSTCVDLYKFADVYSVDIVQNRCLQLIHRNFVEVASSREFYSLNVNQLTEIISHDELDVKAETTVWEAVVRWVQHSKEDRLHLLPSILPHIRFNLLTSYDKAGILEHPLVKENAGSSDVVKNVVQKEGKTKLNPRLGMTMEMVLLYSSIPGSKELIFMNPQKGKCMSCTYKPEDFHDFRDMTVTSDNNIYILQTEILEDNDQLTLRKYKHAENMWEQAGVSIILRGHEDEEHLVEVDGVLYYIAFDPEDDRLLLQIRKYNPHTNQWQECSQLQLDTMNDFARTIYYQNAILSCGPNLYFLISAEMHCYDPRVDRWYRRTPPSRFPEFITAVTMGTEIFCTDIDFSVTMLYDTESDCWQELQGGPYPTNLALRSVPKFFVLENQLHILFTCGSDSQGQGGYKNLVYVYDRSADAWRDLKATVPNTEFSTNSSHWPNDSSLGCFGSERCAVDPGKEMNNTGNPWKEMDRADHPGKDSDSRVTMRTTMGLQQATCELNFFHPDNTSTSQGSTLGPCHVPRSFLPAQGVGKQTGETHYMCEVCGSRTARKCSLALHKRTDSEEISFESDQDDYSEAQKGHLDNHRIAETSVDKPSMCEKSTYSPPEDPPHSSYLCQGLVFSDYCDVICDVGYVPETDDIQGCSWTGNWTAFRRENATEMENAVSAVYESCAALMKDDRHTTSGNYTIDPDGPDFGAEPVSVHCDLDTGTTEVGHDSESRIVVSPRCNPPGCYKRKINSCYRATLEQLSALSAVSRSCKQFFKYDCHHASLGAPDLNMAWWISRDGKERYDWYGSTIKRHTCKCGEKGTCANVTSYPSCNCDNNDYALREDSGYTTDKHTLPVIELAFGDTGDDNEYAHHTLGKFMCEGTNH
ncbi:kelch repeat and BTB domain-containing protein 7-like [Branchiostoma floridae]|uniref:Kelch repeat and BTB domain-containing protein 7-like n=1 Tax=Branchiostoma floridae TaxID=7739 RepID=A0A9J7L5W6_BRAFL|nr:kelch repeat and BTB domain-containing protein 7-like [Branchiostoma floridae]